MAATERDIMMATGLDGYLGRDISVTDLAPPTSNGDVLGRRLALFEGLFSGWQLQVRTDALEEQLGRELDRLYTQLDEETVTVDRGMLVEVVVYSDHLGPVAHAGNMLIPMGTGPNASEVAADDMARPHLRTDPPPGVTVIGSFLWFDRSLEGGLRVWNIPVRQAVWRQGRKILQSRRLLAAQANYAPRILRRAFKTEQTRREAEAQIGRLLSAEARLEFEAMLVQSSKLERRVLELQEEINATLFEIERQVAEKEAGDSLDKLQRAIDMASNIGQLSQMNRGPVRVSDGQVADLTPYAGQWADRLQENTSALQNDLEAISLQIDIERRAFDEQVRQFRDTFGSPITGPY